ncbi:uncharacterized protein LOC112341473 [Selaginella moellendorffii]|uniref:uncharacterized protein LOC112341473 n=1 Tax=Selaginella moellendorffii TaxID=88036 RepID=UPI000D1CD5B3|nr:uncharacterized protein LOC112341473 [Selaginella moellendorffii]|eukprot:XP_024517383.1 uncharacterized protein LOC112341473 [Selaginella moellendorffii]
MRYRISSACASVSRSLLFCCSISWPDLVYLARINASWQATSLSFLLVLRFDRLERCLAVSTVQDRCYSEFGTLTMDWDAVHDPAAGEYQWRIVGVNKTTSAHSHVSDPDAATDRHDKPIHLTMYQPS